MEPAQGSGHGRRPSSRGSGISAAAATAVAQIRRRRTAARAHTLQPHNASSAASVLAANRELAAMPAISAAAPASDPASAGPTADAPGSSHLHIHGAQAQPGLTTMMAADLPAAAAAQQCDVSHAAHSQPAEVTDQATAGTSRGRQPMDRALSVSRPPLPYHGTRRSARLHKAADPAPADLSQPGPRDQADVQCNAGRPLPDAHMVTETCGPCTRYALCVTHEEVLSAAAAPVWLLPGSTVAVIRV